MADWVADSIIASKGKPEMALASCFGAPLITHVMGLSFAIIVSIHGADPGILEWWGCMINAREVHTKICRTHPLFKDHTHFIAQRGSNLSADCTTNSLESGFYNLFRTWPLLPPSS